MTEDFIEVWSEPVGDALDVNGMILDGSLSKNITVYGHAWVPKRLLHETFQRKQALRVQARALYFPGNLVEKVNAENKPGSEPYLASAVVSGLPMVKKYLNMKVHRGF